MRTIKQVIELYPVTNKTEWTKTKTGGWIHQSAKVENPENIQEGAIVFGDARVYGNARICGDAQVCGNAQVYGDARICGDAWILSPLQIQGTWHFVNMATKDILKIGCYELLISDWLKKYKAIGKEAGYTPAQIKEYYLYIKLAKELYAKQSPAQPEK